MTCFLEYADTQVVVHDILQELTPDGWTTRVSHQRKLRLAPANLAALMEASGFAVRQDVGPRGLVRLLVEQRPSRRLRAGGSGLSARR